MSQGELPKSDIAAAFRTCQNAFWGVGLFSSIINLLMLTGPLFMLQVYDRVLASGSVPTLVALFILVVGLFIFMGLLEIVRGRILVRIGRQIDEQIGHHVFDKVLFHALKHTSNVKAQPLRDLDTLRQFLSGPGPAALFDAPWMPIYIAVIFLMHTWLGIFASLGAIVLLIFALINELTTRRPLEQAAQSNIAAHAFAEENRRNAEVVQAMGMLPVMRARWQSFRQTALSDHDKAGDRSGTISGASKSIRLLLQSAMLALGAYLAVKQEITPGAMIAASIIMSRALAPVEQSITHWRSFLNFRRAYRRLKLVFEKTQESERPMELPKPQGHIQAENLVASALGRTKPLLQGVNFTLEPGEALGVIGPTGAGKSTLARLLVGVWPVLRGSFKIDSAPIEQWSPEQIGQFIGYLPQGVELFSGTVAENISRFTEDPDPESVIKAAQLANVHELILALPDGYKTKIGEGGSALSAGQRQRIGLARALYGDPVFVVLDEPNSNLDMEGDIALHQAMVSLKENKTTVVIIAHRPAAINAVDFLLCIRDGQQIAFGPREEVLQKVARPSSQEQHASL